MYYRITKLKRYKLLNLILNIVSFPIRFPIFLLYVIAENVTKIAENLLDICDKVMIELVYEMVDNNRKKKYVVTREMVEESLGFKKEQEELKAENA